MPMFIRSFSTLRSTDASIAGGKGSSLGEMTQAGIPVPPGFVILADAFESFIDHNTLRSEIATILAQLDHNSVASLERSSELLQELIQKGEIPEELKKEIHTYHENLGAEFVAVRSSATAEDGKDHAWAGQLDTFLNVEKGEILEKIQHCWASLFTPRALFYGYEKGFHKAPLRKGDKGGLEISVAVVIQVMIQSESAGVAFSVHPVTENPDEIVIEGSWGLGEAVVSGQVTPDSFVVDKKLLPPSLLEKGGVEARDGGLGKNINAYSDEEKYLPYNIELKNYAQELRKNMTLAEKRMWYDVLKYGELKQHAFLRQKPLLNYIADFYCSGLKLVIEVDGDNHEDQRWYDSKRTEELEKYDITVLRFHNLRVIDDPKSVEQEILQWIYKQQSSVRRGGHLLSQGGFVSITSRHIAKKEKGMFFMQGKNEWREISDAEKEKPILSDDQIYDLAQLIITIEQHYGFPCDVEWAFAKDEFFILQARPITTLEKKDAKENKLSKLYQKQISLTEWFQNIGHEQADILRTEDNEKHERLKSLNRYIGLPFDKPTKFHPRDIVEKSSEFTTYLSEHGHEKCALRLIPLESSLPKLRMRGQTISEVVENWLPQQVIDPDKYRAEFIPHPERNIWATIFIVNEKGIFGEIIADGHHHLTQGFYENVKPSTFFYDFNTWKTFPENPEAEKYLAEMTQYICIQDSSLQDILQTELGASFSHNYLMGYFETTYSEFGTWFIDYSPALGKMYGDFSLASSEINGDLRGISAYPGKIIGKARIVNDPSGIQLQPDEILICDMTSPDYVQLMQQAAGIITNRGGVLSHAGIIARELRKPTILATGNATEVLHDGDMIEMDAEKGEIKILTGKTQWKKVVTREFPYIWAAYTIECYQIMEEIVGTTLSKNLFYGEGDILSIYRTDEDVQKSYTMIQNLVKNNPERVKQLMVTHESLVQRVYTSLDKMEQEYDKGVIREGLLEFDQLWIEAVSHYLFFVFMGYAGDMDYIDSFIAENKERFENIRNKYTIDVDVNERYPVLFEKYRKGFGELAALMSPQELRDMLNDKHIDLDKINSRKEKYLIIMENNEIKEYFRKDLDDSLKSELAQTNIDKNSKEIKGSIAYKGKMIGRARLVLTRADYDKMSDGDIIVTPMTKPNIAPYLKKVAAIVTNDGGALSHASIISREMKIPCIVGTTHATDIIKDGDRVEVDAEKGIVRIL